MATFDKKSLLPVYLELFSCKSRFKENHRRVVAPWEEGLTLSRIVNRGSRKIIVHLLGGRTDIVKKFVCRHTSRIGRLEYDSRHHWKTILEDKNAFVLLEKWIGANDLLPKK
eukprot:scaffold784_cov62-Cylindrotheca_fusiformis.AAC.2